MSRIAAWKESITGFCFNRRLNVYEVCHKKETNPIAGEPRVGGERQTDGYRTCSDLSQCYKAERDRFTQYKWTHLHI